MLLSVTAKLTRSEPYAHTVGLPVWTAQAGEARGSCFPSHYPSCASHSLKNPPFCACQLAFGLTYLIVAWLHFVTQIICHNVSHNMSHNACNLWDKWSVVEVTHFTFSLPRVKPKSILWINVSWPFKWKLLSSTFMWYCLLCCTRWF